MDNETVKDQPLAKQVEQLVQRFPLFSWSDGPIGGQATGRVQTSDGHAYTLMLVVPAGFPEEAPRLYVIEPRDLPIAGGGTIKALGSSHAFHTYANGPNGPVQIDYPRGRRSRPTLTGVVLGGFLWLEAYSAHLRDGRDLSVLLGC